MLVHGASGGVSIPRRQVIENNVSVFASASSWDMSCGHICVNRLADWVFYFRYSRIHFLRTNSVIPNSCETARVLV